MREYKEVEIPIRIVTTETDFDGKKIPKRENLVLMTFDLRDLINYHPCNDDEESEEFNHTLMFLNGHTGNFVVDLPYEKFKKLIGERVKSDEPLHEFPLENRKDYCYGAIGYATTT